MMESNKDELKFVEKLSDSVISRLAGQHKYYDSFESSNPPSQQIILGTLCAKPKINELNKPSSAVETNAMSISFLVNDFNSIKVTPKFAVFFGKKKNVENEEKKYSLMTPKVFKKFPIEIPAISFSKTKQEYVFDFKDIRKEVAKDQEVNEKDVPEWGGRIFVELNEYEQKNQTLKLVTVTFENLSEQEGNNKFKEVSFFNSNLQIELKEEIIPFSFSYNYEGYSEEYSVDLQCTNCSAKYDNKVIKTTIAKTHIQTKIEPNDNLKTLQGEEIKVLFSDLIDEDKRNNFLTNILDEMKAYLNLYDSKKTTDKKYLDSMNNFQKVISKFERSIKLLSENETASRAFTLLQKSFERASEHLGWRLFQLIFIINTIPDIVNKENFEIAEVLHVDTGGGKSEAYFGLAIFTSFFDRLSGKAFGVTGITKFPLRMLSIQQLQRVADIFIFAEEIRKDEGIEGFPFSVAYFVGSSKEFPRDNNEIIEQIKKEKTIGKIIDKCPLCTKQKTESEVWLNHNQEDGTVTHKCETCNKEFFLYFSDDEVYRKLPTFIVATVDKFAGIAGNRRFRNLFGGHLTECPNNHGFIPSGDVCEADKGKCKLEGRETNIDFNPCPSIVVQDEMHLIREGFGTIDSHFESFMEVLQKELRGSGFKNIAMTATISGAENQIYQLYKKEASVFPGSSPFGKGVTDFFFTQKEDTHRVLVGLKPNVRENNFAIRLTLGYILKFISEVESDKNKFCEENDINIETLNSSLRIYKSYLSYHQKKDDVQTLNNLLQYESDEINLKTDSEYKIKPLVLTGDETLDRIREIILDIDKQDTENTKELFNVCATSVVSHGVDIEKWNVMCFQGMPRSTAEYIQSLSRVGRRHIGLVFMWFYPNRVRDLSFFNKFEEYHKILNHHVKPVPILRWAKLGFHQTFNSLFCASVINYFSDVYNKPLYRVPDVNAIFSEATDFKEQRKKLIEFLMKTYMLNTDESGAEYFKDNIDNEVEMRLNKLAKYKGIKDNFFPNALSESNNQYFKNQFGMRGIQSEVLVKPRKYTEIQFISGFRNNSKRSKNE